MSDHHADRMAQQQHRQKQDEPRDPGAHVRLRQQATQVRFQAAREMPGDEGGNDPGGEGDDFAEQTPYEAYRARNDHGRDNQVIGDIEVD